MANVSGGNTDKNGQNAQVRRFEDVVQKILTVSKEDLAKVEKSAKVNEHSVVAKGSE